MLRRPILWTVDTIAVVAAAALTVCVVVRGLMSEAPKTGKRTPEVKRPDPWASN